MQRIMYGRYGNDSLNKFLLVVCLIVLVLDMFLSKHLLRVLGVLLLIYIYCRMFSRNYPARAKENQKFLDATSAFRRGKKAAGSYRSGTGYGSSQTRTKPQKDKTHKILRCPACGEKLRVPKGLGKISITCPHCNLKFIKKV